ncbi:MAG TPA: TolC family protein [Polyangia bacterium]|jgi:outer membrane protein TolC|nr:TolC family protein [Polyangia bacterium]
MIVRSLLVWPALIVALAVSPASAKKFTLEELIQMSRGNPGLQADAAATAAMQAQVLEAKLNWLPQGSVLSILAPSPKEECFNVWGVRSESQCVSTTSPEVNLSSLSWNRVFTHTEVQLIQPVWDFGKISAGIAAAKAGVGVSREREAGSRADLDLNVRKAYFGLKLAREVLDALDEGGSYIESAQKTIDKDLSKGTGSSTVTDRLRMRTVHADLDARVLETKRLQGLAIDSLRTLIGPDAPGEIDVDDDPFEPPDVPQRPVTYYEDLARATRPEVKMLEYAVKAKHALADLERRKEYPDLIIIGGAVYASAQGVDNPTNAFFSHYYNSTAAGVAAGLRIPLDLGPKIARSKRLAAEAEQTGFQQSAAMGGIMLEVRKAYGEVNEARARVASMEKGEKAGKAWISAVAQNFAVGLSEARDFSDALIAFFGMRTRYLQAVYDFDIALSSLARATGVADFRNL